MLRLSSLRSGRVAEAELLGRLAMDGVAERPLDSPEVPHTLIAQRQIADELWRLGHFAAAEKVS